MATKRACSEVIGFAVVNPVKSRLNKTVINFFMAQDF
jgi:hypothetical protein